MRTLTVCNASAGSGKTFTLAAYYVACLIHEHNEGAYRTILAVTFTNKATAEMKDRILTHLYAMATGAEDEAFIRKVDEVLRMMGDNVPENEMRRQAGVFFEEMLAHYDDVQVTTIDSFLQLLLTGLAQAIGLSASFAVELGVKRVIREAVDQIMSTHITEQKGLVEAISDYLTERLDNESNWDIRDGLRVLAANLFDEAVQEKDEVLVLAPERLQAFHNAIRWERTPAHADLLRQYNALMETGDSVAKLKGGRNFTAFFKQVKTMLDGKVPKTFTISEQGMGFLNDGKDPLYEPVRQLQEAVLQYRQTFLVRLLTTEHLSNLMLLGFIRNRIKSNLADANSALLAETASKLERALRPGDADFILEKAGIRFKHILLDEFQDTSTLQWANFLKLIEEVLASGGTTLIVGDTKQSIYRWRNGNRHIMESLTPEHPSLGAFHQAKPLRTNYRSLREVVRFNLETFSRLPALIGQQDLYDEHFVPGDGQTGGNLSDYYVEGAHEGGYVQFRAYPYGQKERGKVRDVLLRDMFAEIESLLAQGVQPKDCLILIRKGDEAEEVIRLFRSLRQDKDHHPLLSATDIVSSDSFCLDSSRSVNVAVSGLKFVLRGDSIAEEYIRLAAPSSDLEALRQVKPNLPLTEMLEEVIRLCLCPEGTFEAEDVLYLNSLQDKVRSYVTKNGADPLAFLTYWDDVMHEETIGATDSPAIRLMTIHKSKGLEGKNVFIPFCQWEMSKMNGAMLWCEPSIQPPEADKQLAIVPISYHKGLEETGYAERFERELQDEYVDNMNLLYVALTRAAERLFIYADLSAKVTDAPASNVGTMLLNDRGLQEDFRQTASGSTPEGRFVEYKAGEKEVTVSSFKVQGEKKKGLPEPFSFKDAAALRAEYHCGDGRIVFRQSQESLGYTMYGSVKGLEAVNKRAFGTICHDILAQVERVGEEERVIRAFARQGIIPNGEVEAAVREAIGRAWDNEQMRDWFSGEWELMREQSILLPERLRRQFSSAIDEVKEQRPDRVMIRGNKAVVLDYKFGEMNERAYLPQVRGYMQLMRELGYAEVEGYLWFAETGQLVLVQ